MSTVQTFDFSVDLLSVLLWTDNEAENFINLIEHKQAWIDLNHKEFWESWVRDVFNLVTATEFGLSGWSIILDTPLQFGTGKNPPGKPIFGFGALKKNFNRGVFTNDDSVIILSLEEKRLVLRLKYFKLVSRGAVLEINAFLMEIFKDRGRAYVLDIYDMSMRVVFDFPLDTRLVFILNQYDVIPRPQAVGLSYYFTGEKVFGFGSSKRNFNRGHFYREIVGGKLND